MPPMHIQVKFRDEPLEKLWGEGVGEVQNKIMQGKIMWKKNHAQQVAGPGKNSGIDLPNFSHKENIHERDFAKQRGKFNQKVNAA